jgi:hypothetical protein
MPYFLLCFLSIKEYAAQFFSVTTYAAVCSISLLCYCVYVNRGMRHTSTALYFYGASKKSLQKPRVIYGNILFHISYGFIYYLQLLCLQFLSKTHLNFKKFTFCIKMALFLKSSLFQSRIDKIAHVQNKTFTDQLDINFFLVS